MKLRRLMNEVKCDNLSLAKKAFKPYMVILSKFKPSKIKHSPGVDSDTYFIELNVKDQAEKPILFIDFKCGADDIRNYSQTPVDRVMINIWTHVKSIKYRDSISKLLFLLSIKDPNMPIIWNENDLDKNVKFYSNPLNLQTRIII